MSNLLNQEQLEQLVNNTLVVLIAKPDLKDEWHADLTGWMEQMRTAQQEDEAIFLAALLTLLWWPDDTLPTATSYDYAWELLMIGMQTGTLQRVPAPASDETLTIGQLLRSVVDAAALVLQRAPEEQDQLDTELHQMQRAADRAGLDDLALWLTDVLALLHGTPARDLGADQTGIFATYWEMLARRVDPGE